ncbi:MAG: hypothetical protein PHX21_07285 [bacterium]|nr:hypothetical protein [bacterium]
MGRSVLLVIGIVVSFLGCSSKLSQERTHKKTYDNSVYKVRAALYRCPYKEVRNAVYSIVAEQFSITKETEGHIEADYKPVNIQQRVRVIVEILGDSLYRVAIRCPCQKESKIMEKVPDTTKTSFHLEYKAWKDTEDDTELADKFYYSLYDRLKEYEVK